MVYNYLCDGGENITAPNKTTTSQTTRKKKAGRKVEFHRCSLPPPEPNVDSGAVVSNKDPGREVEGWSSQYPRHNTIVNKFEQTTVPKEI